MLNKILSNSDFQNISKKQVKEIIEFLLSIDCEFAVTANIAALEFKPELPKPIQEQFSPFPLFELKNYTYSTIEVHDDFLSFEAGFGKENFGSVVKVPYLAVFQIVVDKTMLHINTIAPSSEFLKENDIQKSINIFKNNPKNKKLFKE